VDLTISIVYVYEKDLIENCIKSIYESKPECSFEIYLVDNNSGHDEPRIIKGKYPDINLLQTQHLFSFSAANNWVIHRAKGEFVLLMNPDIETLPGSLDNFVAFMRKYPEAGAASGVLLSRANMKPQVGFNIREFPKVKSTIFELFLLDRIFPNSKTMRRANMLEFNYNIEQEVEQPAGACLMLRKSILKTTGYLDEKFHPVWYEDVDICRRMYLYGLNVMFTPDAKFIHEGGMGVRRLSRSQAALSRFSNLVYYYRKHHGTLYSYLMKVLIVMASVLRIGVTILSFIVPDKILAKFAHPLSNRMRIDIIKAHFKVIRMIMLNVHTYMLEESGHLTNKFVREE